VNWRGTPLQEFIGKKEVSVTNEKKTSKGRRKKKTKRANQV